MISRAFFWLRSLPPRLYRRYRPLWERTPIAGLIAGLFWLTAHSLGTLPADWLGFLTGTLGLLALISPAAGYLAFALAMGLTLYTVSIYLAVLGLAVFLPPWFFVPPERLILSLWMLAAIALAPYHLALLGPFLIALWQGEKDGFLVGFGSAWWLKVIAGMNALSPNLTTLSGHVVMSSHFATRFQHANSLQTVLWIIGPLTPNTHTLLYHLLQTLGWGIAAWSVGWVGAQKGWVTRWKWLLVMAAALLGVALGNTVLPHVLKLSAGWQFSLPALLEAPLAAIVAWLLFGAYRYLEGPIAARLHPAPSPPPRSPIREAAPATAEAPFDTAAETASPAPPPSEETEHDIIMLDLG